MAPDIRTISWLYARLSNRYEHRSGLLDRGDGRGKRQESGNVELVGACHRKRPPELGLHRVEHVVYHFEGGV